MKSKYRHSGNAYENYNAKHKCHVRKDLTPEAFEALEKHIKRKSSVLDSGCWEWHAMSRNGYGVAYYGGRKVPAHRLSYMIANQVALEPHQYVCHACDNKSCVNPDHLYVGNAKTNSNDVVAARRNGGRIDPGSIDKDKALAIRAHFNRTKNAIEVGNEHGLAAADVMLVVSYEDWPWLA